MLVQLERSLSRFRSYLCANSSAHQFSDFHFLDYCLGIAFGISGDSWVEVGAEQGVRRIELDPGLRRPDAVTLKVVSYFDIDVAGRFRGVLDDLVEGVSTRSIGRVQKIVGVRPTASASAVGAVSPRHSQTPFNAESLESAKDSQKISQSLQRTPRGQCGMGKEMFSRTR